MTPRKTSKPTTPMARKSKKPEQVEKITSFVKITHNSNKDDALDTASSLSYPASPPSSRTSKGSSSNTTLPPQYLANAQQTTKPASTSTQSNEIAPEIASLLYDDGADNYAFAELGMSYEDGDSDVELDEDDLFAEQFNQSFAHALGAYGVELPDLAEKVLVMDVAKDELTTTAAAAAAAAAQASTVSHSASSFSLLESAPTSSYSDSTHTEPKYNDTFPDTSREDVAHTYSQGSTSTSTSTSSLLDDSAPYTALSRNALSRAAPSLIPTAKEEQHVASPSVPATPSLNPSASFTTSTSTSTSATSSRLTAAPPSTSRAYMDALRSAITPAERQAILRSRTALSKLVLPRIAAIEEHGLGMQALARYTAAAAAMRCVPWPDATSIPEELAREFTDSRYEITGEMDGATKSENMGAPTSLSTSPTPTSTSTTVSVTACGNTSTASTLPALAPIPRLLPPLGLHTECTDLLSTLDRALDGRGNNAVLLQGAHGAGKSLCVRSVLAYVQARHAYRQQQTQPHVATIPYVLVHINGGVCADDQPALRDAVHQVCLQLGVACPLPPTASFLDLAQFLASLILQTNNMTQAAVAARSGKAVLAPLNPLASAVPHAGNPATQSQAEVKAQAHGTGTGSSDMPPVPFIFLLDGFEHFARRGTKANAGALAVGRQPLLYFLCDMIQASAARVAIIASTVSITCYDLLEKRVRSRLPMRTIAFKHGVGDVANARTMLYAMLAMPVQEGWQWNRALAATRVAELEAKTKSKSSGGGGSLYSTSTSTSTSTSSLSTSAVLPPTHSSTSTSSFSCFPTSSSAKATLDAIIRSYVSHVPSHGHVLVSLRRLPQAERAKAYNMCLWATLTDPNVERHILADNIALGRSRRWFMQLGKATISASLRFPSYHEIVESKPGVGKVISSAWTPRGQRREVSVFEDGRLRSREMSLWSKQDEKKDDEGGEEEKALNDGQRTGKRRRANGKVRGKTEGKKCAVDKTLAMPTKKRRIAKGSDGIDEEAEEVRIEEEEEEEDEEEGVFSLLGGASLHLHNTTPAENNDETRKTGAKTKNNAAGRNISVAKTGNQEKSSREEAEEGMCSDEPSSADDCDEERKAEEMEAIIDAVIPLRICPWDIWAAATLISSDARWVRVRHELQRKNSEAFFTRLHELRSSLLPRSVIGNGKGRASGSDHAGRSSAPCTPISRPSRPVTPSSSRPTTPSLSRTQTPTHPSTSLSHITISRSPATTSISTSTSNTSLAALSRWVGQEAVTPVPTMYLTLTDCSMLELSLLVTACLLEKQGVVPYTFERIYAEYFAYCTHTSARKQLSAYCFPRQVCYQAFLSLLDAEVLTYVIRASGGENTEDTNATGAGVNVVGGMGVGDSLSMFISETGEQSTGRGGDNVNSELWTTINNQEVADRLDPRTAPVRLTINERECLYFIENPQNGLPSWLMQWAQGYVPTNK